jgi:hypothetical protein
MLKDRRVDLVEMPVWCCENAGVATPLKDYIEPFSCKSFPFADKLTCSCSLDK